MPRKSTNKTTPESLEATKSQEETLLEAVAQGTATSVAPKKRKVVIEADATPVVEGDNLVVVGDEAVGPAGDQPLSFDTQLAAGTYLKQLYSGPNGRVLVTDAKWNGGHNFRLVCKGCDQFQASCIRSRGSKKLILSPRSVLEHGPEHEDAPNGPGTYERDLPRRSKTPKIEHVAVEDNTADAAEDNAAVVIIDAPAPVVAAPTPKPAKEKGGRIAKQIAALKTKYNLQPHPEGGFFSETYRSDRNVTLGKESIAASTAIYYLLTPDAISKFRKIKHDEIYHFYLGGPLAVVELGEEGVKETVLGNDIHQGQLLQYVVKGGTWFGCYPKNTTFSLVGATVAPGFQFKDLEMGEKTALLQEFPAASEIIEKLT